MFFTSEGGWLGAEDLLEGGCWYDECFDPATSGDDDTDHFAIEIGNGSAAFVGEVVVLILWGFVQLDTHVGLDDAGEIMADVAGHRAHALHGIHAFLGDSTGIEFLRA